MVATNFSTKKPPTLGVKSASQSTLHCRDSAKRSVGWEAAVRSWWCAEQPGRGDGEAPGPALPAEPVAITGGQEGRMSSAVDDYRGQG